jgi:hypothetical protein
MNVLYKYCDQLGAVKILGSLELKLPYVSEVNDPLECLPFFYCPNDKTAIEARYLSVLKHRNMSPPADYKQKLEKVEIYKILEESLRDLQRDWNQQNCLLSFSKTAQNTVMWAHYTDKHKGIVIGVDFDKFFPGSAIKMHNVNYSEQRYRINILPEITPEIYLNALCTKSADWKYEREFRTLFSDGQLKEFQQQGLACLRDFNGRPTWFWRLNPESIREVVFGLYTEDGLKSAIRKLIERPELQHVKLYQTNEKESETYTLKLVEIKN